MKSLKTCLLIFTLVAFGLFGWGAKALAAPQVELIQAGTGAKQPLRILAQETAKQAVNVTWNMVVNTNMGGVEFALEVPPADMQFESIVSSGTGAEAISYRSELVAMKLDTSKADQTNPMVVKMISDMEGLVGVSGDVQIQRTGEPISSEWVQKGTGADEIASELTRAMEQALVVFPTEAVGIGAKWTVSEDLTERGMQFTRTVHVELVERKGNQVRLKLVVTAKTKSTKVLSEMLPPGTTGTLKQFEMNGTGTVLHDLSRLFPLESDMSIVLDTLLVASGQGQTMDVRTGMNFKVTVRGE